MQSHCIYVNQWDLVGFVSIRLSNLKESATQKWVVAEEEMEVVGGGWFLNFL